MNFSEFARSGTAPSSKLKSSVANASLFTVRPKTRAGDGDINDLNVDLRTNKINSEPNHFSQDKSDNFISFKKRQENEEYLKAMESFHAAVDNWSGKKDVDSNGDGKRPESRSRVSKDPNKKQSLYMSGLSAYTQNVPSILLQPSKRGTKNPVGSSPRARDKSTSNHINELRAAYGADFVASGHKGATAKLKAAKPRPPVSATQDALRYQEDVQAAAPLRSSSAHRPSVEPLASSGSNRPQTQVNSSRQGAYSGEFGGGRDSAPAKRVSKKAAVVAQAALRPTNRSGSSGAAPTADPSNKPRDELPGKTMCEPLSHLPVYSANSTASASRRPEDALSCGLQSPSEPSSRGSRGSDRILPGHAGGSTALGGARSQGNLLSSDGAMGATTSAKRKDPQAVQSVQQQQRNLAHSGTDATSPEDSSAARKVAPLTPAVEVERPPAVAGEAVGLPGRGSTMVTSSPSLALALERPQSRKLYLGNEKSGSSSASKPATKAPKSAGARYSNFSPSRGGRDALDEASDPFIFRQGSLKRMSSFGGFSGGAQPAASRGPWLEEDHLPVRRPPSRQSSAFPVHLADAPAMPATDRPSDAEAGGANGPSSSSSTKARHKDERAVGDAGARSASPSAVLAADQHAEDGGTKLMHRPPSRQKLAAQHLFEGMRGSHQSSGDSEPGEHCPDETEVRSRFRHTGAADAPTSKPRPDTTAGDGAVGRGRSAAAASPRTGLFYNPRDDGFLELQDTNGVGGSVLPFSITVNYGPDAEAPDYTVVAAESLRGNPQSRSYNTSHSSRNGAAAAQHGRRGEIGGGAPTHHRRMDSLETAASELSLIDLAAAVVPESSRGHRAARRSSGNRPASGSWESAEVEGGCEQGRARPKTVTAPPLNGAKGANNGNYAVSQTSHAHSRNRSTGEPLAGAGSRSRADGEWADASRFLVGEPSQQRSSLPLSRTAGQKGAAWTAESTSSRRASALGFSSDVGSPGSRSAAHSSARRLSDSPATFSDAATRDYIQNDDNEEDEEDGPGWFGSRQSERDDDMTIMTEDSGRSGDSRLSIRSFTLESSLGEDFLNLFAPGGR